MIDMPPSDIRAVVTGESVHVAGRFVPDEVGASTAARWDGVRDVT